MKRTKHADDHTTVQGVNNQELDRKCEDHDGVPEQDVSVSVVTGEFKTDDLATTTLPENKQVGLTITAKQGNISSFFLGVD